MHDIVRSRRPLSRIHSPMAEVMFHKHCPLSLVFFYNMTGMAQPGNAGRQTANNHCLSHWCRVYSLGRPDNPTGWHRQTANP